MPDQLRAKVCRLRLTWEQPCGGVVFVLRRLDLFRNVHSLHIGVHKRVLEDIFEGNPRLQHGDTVPTEPDVNVSPSVNIAAGSGVPRNIQLTTEALGFELDGGDIKQRHKKSLTYLEAYFKRQMAES